MHLSMLLLFMLLITALWLKLPLYLALMIGLVPFVVTAHRQGWQLPVLLHCAAAGLKKPAKVYLIMLLVGAATSLWLASGTLPLLITLGLNWINPQWFILFVFCFTWLMTLLIGSAIGTFGMVGILMVTMAAMGDVSVPLTAGTVVSAVYLGERSSPMSSCAHLVAEVSGISIYRYIRHNLIYSLPVIVASLLFYGTVSYFNPLHLTSAAAVTAEMGSVFTLSPWGLVPVAVLVISLLLRHQVTTALVLSIVSAAVVALLLQEKSLADVVTIAYFGYAPKITLEGLSHFKASGLFGMAKAVLVVMAASLYTGLFEGTDLLSPIKKSILTLSRNGKPFYAVLASGFLGAALGCSQTFAVLFSHQLVQDSYDHTAKQRQQLAVDLSNSGVLVSALIPWNIAASVPALLLGCGFAYMPFALLIYLAPLHALIWAQKSPRHAEAVKTAIDSEAYSPAASRTGQ